MERETRLQLRSFRPALEHVDGAWWPRSRQLVDELPGLVASITERLGPIVMVSYHRNGWDQTPTVAEIAGHTVELLGFSSDDPASLILIGQDRSPSDAAGDLTGCQRPECAADPR
ncbi:DUF5994 family protein [Mycobacterium ulcerans]|uniref:DUF5994 family protein n=1 Tax=Mycobacterium ulcerans TaxID=1809 RepID=A0ABY3V845_MYCUL|nr:DUF5994 family protein [Mycobacterium ulcerans]MEB3905309.1 DUF5994 family protein [Mycobacterium ulcerans]MEB3909505.1 DUF5994 family protein [Mycobacterium ulcerans]MEB3919751.1 DUF5994 family protein [Mycobacterium ulcerans]MEB3923822.1 DUF5994 family protein [Mycobacterium ulcerans]MEB3928012.1 DUF5994 family protein [Mycobacterium ulcerans]